MVSDSGARTAVVTGGAAGIGRTVAGRLQAAGYQVVVFDREPAEQRTMITLQGDVTDAGDVEALAAKLEQHGALHLLVNAVGFACEGSFETLTLEAWRSAFDLNLTSVFLVTRALLPLMRRTEGDRVIVNLSSTLARVCDPQVIAYGAMKAGLEHLTRTLALDLAPHGIRVVAVAPGPVTGTPGETRWPEREYRSLNPMNRFATPDEIAAFVAFLAGPDARYITGSVHAIDGGDSALGAGWGSLPLSLYT